MVWKKAPMFGNSFQRMLGSENIGSNLDYNMFDDDYSQNDHGDAPAANFHALKSKRSYLP